MAKISAGSYDVNGWLHGGYDCDVITTFYGGAGSGKTNFCLLAAVSQAKKGNKVVFVDTEGGFSSERVKQLLNIGNGNDGKDGKKDYEEVLKNILVLRPTNFKEQKDAFKQLQIYLKKQISLIIVDGMTMLYRLDFAAAREKGDDITEIQKVNSELTRQMRLLAEISRKQNIPILVTNQIYKWEDEQKMVGGDILKYWSKCLIELVNDGGRKTAHLRKHRSLPDKRFPFQIINEGVKRRGWI
jgi:DNA repair protein RadB